jgi:hypothetical protein
MPSLRPGSSLNLPTGQILNAQPPSKGEPAPTNSVGGKLFYAVYHSSPKLSLTAIRPGCGENIMNKLNYGITIDEKVFPLSFVFPKFVT